MRILAIDYGKKRCGLAVTDTLQIAANALDTVATGLLLGYVADYCRREQVEEIIIGAPLRLDGTESETMPRVHKFVEKLRMALPEMRITEVDERFTSRLAHRALAQAGIHKKTLADRGLPDRMAAVIMLTDHLQSKSFC